MKQAPDKCPGCGVPLVVLPDGGKAMHHYECGSIWMADGTLAIGAGCWENQCNNLRIVGDGLASAARQAHDDRHACGTMKHRLAVALAAYEAATKALK